MLSGRPADHTSLGGARCASHVTKNKVGKRKKRHKEQGGKKHHDTFHAFTVAGSFFPKDFKLELNEQVFVTNISKCNVGSEIETIASNFIAGLQ